MDAEEERIERERDAWLMAQTSRLLCAAVDRDIARVLTVLEGIGNRYDDEGVYLLCLALAAVVHDTTLPGVAQGDGTLQDGPLVAADLSGTPEQVWTARFVAAFLNGDYQTTDALFYGALHDRQQAMLNVVELIGMAATPVREKEHALSGGIEPAGMVMLARTLLRAAIAGDADTAERTLQVVAQDYGPQGIYDICCSMADAVRVFLFPEVAIEIDDRVAGMVTVGQLQQRMPMSQHRDDVWATRFTIAFLNGEIRTCAAMFAGAGNAMSENVAAMVAMGGWAGATSIRGTATPGR